jgi:hypothetical protein
VSFLSVRRNVDGTAIQADTPDSKIGFLDRSSLTFPVVSVLAAAINAGADTVLNIPVTNLAPEFIIAAFFGLLLLVADLVAHPESNNSFLKVLFSILLGAVNSVLIALSLFGITTVVGGALPSVGS